MRIKMRDGVVVKLCGVKHIPKLKKIDLIKSLKCSGDDYKIVCGLIEVENDVMLMMKGKRDVKNIYMLVGGIVVSGVTFF